MSLISAQTFPLVLRAVRLFHHVPVSRTNCVLRNAWRKHRLAKHGSLRARPGAEGPARIGRAPHGTAPVSVDPPDAASAQPAPAFEPEAEAKRLLRVVRSGALATLTASGDPFSSLVSVATEPDGSPLILVSQLSAHTRHLDRDGRCSLLLAETGEGDPLRHARLTVTGTAGKLTAAADRVAARTRFLARHPQAALYADFGDFSFWRVAMRADPPQRRLRPGGAFSRGAGG